MPVSIYKFERNPGVDRNAFAMAALNLCRAVKAANPKVQSHRFYWVDANTIGFVVQGQNGFNDYNPNPDPNVAKAQFALADMANMTNIGLWADAGVGERSWEIAGKPSGTD